MNAELCPLCRRSVDSIQHLAEEAMITFIRSRNPSWVQEGGTCPPCIQYYEKLRQTEA